MKAGKFKIVEISEKPWNDRWKPLTELCLKEFNLEVQSEFCQATTQDFPDKIKGILAGDANVCAVGLEFSSLILNSLPQLTQEAIQIGATDILVRDRSGWWPRPCLDEGFTRVISRQIGQINFDSSALVGGVNGYAKLIIGALAKLGFLTINIIESSEKEGEAILAEMKKKYFQIDFDFIGFDRVTKLPGVHSLLMNTIPLTLENEILDELYFFNFLDRKGSVMDLSLSPAKTPLIIEADQWGARHLSGDYFWAERDAIMIQRATREKIDVETYRKALEKMVEATAFDPSPYLKRFRERGT